MSYSPDAQFRLLIALVQKMAARGAITAEDLAEISDKFLGGANDASYPVEHRQMLREVGRMAGSLHDAIKPPHRAPPDLRVVPTPDPEE